MAGRGEDGGAQKLRPNQLPYGVSRQAAGEGHRGRHLVGGEMLSAPVQELIFGRVGPGPHDHECLRYKFVAVF